MKERKNYYDQINKLNQESNVSSTFSNLKFFSPESSRTMMKIINQKGEQIDNILKVIDKISIGKTNDTVASLRRNKENSSTRPFKKISLNDIFSNKKQQKITMNFKVKTINRENDFPSNLIMTINENYSPINKIQKDIISKEIFLTNLHENQFQSIMRRKKNSLPNFNEKIKDRSRNILVIRNDMSLKENNYFTRKKMIMEFNDKLTSQEINASNLGKIIKFQRRNNFTSGEKKQIEELNKDINALRDDPKIEENHSSETHHQRVMKFDKVSRINDELVFKYRDMINDRYKMSPPKEDMIYFKLSNKEFDDPNEKANIYHKKVKNILKRTAQTKTFLLKKMDKIQKDEYNQILI